MTLYFQFYTFHFRLMKSFLFSISYNIVLCMKIIQMRKIWNMFIRTLLPCLYFLTRYKSNSQCSRAFEKKIILKIAPSGSCVFCKQFYPFNGWQGGKKSPNLFLSCFKYQSVMCNSKTCFTSHLYSVKSVQILKDAL